LSDWVVGNLPICCAKLSENLCRKYSTSVKARHGVPLEHTVLGFFLFSWYTAKPKTGYLINSAHIIRNYRKKALRISRNINLSENMIGSGNSGDIFSFLIIGNAYNTTSDVINVFTEKKKYFQNCPILVTTEPKI
jgi:hypothetical protein